LMFLSTTYLKCRWAESSSNVKINHSALFICYLNLETIFETGNICVKILSSGYYVTFWS
jgi:hypothetical protein